MQKIFKSILSFCLAVAVCLGTAAIFGATQYSYTVADADTANSYYSGITASGGTQLLGQLHDLITTTHTYYTSYDDCKADNAKKTDPGSASNTVMEFYTHIDIDASKWDVSGGWNREHVWAKSDSNGLWQTSGAGSDLHHIRPAEKDLNNHRGNMKYGEVTNGTEQYTSVSHVLGGHSTGSSSTGTFEPLDNVKGDVARILMYVYVHYNTFSNSVFGGNATTNGKGNGSYFGTINFTHIVSASSEDAAKQLLLKWNKLDPVDQIERTRNEEVYKIEHNRNPFIDNSSYADAIWGGGTVIDPGPGPGPQPSVTLKGITLSATALNLNVGDTHNLTVTPNPGNASASVTWASSNTSVATVSGGKVTAKAAGTATITATSTVDTSIKATATVTVRQSSSSETNAGKITVTRQSFKASGGYGTYTWTSGDIGGTAFIYAGNSNSMQFNTSQTLRYIASDKATGGAIKKLTVKTSGNSSWTLYTSTQPYSGITSGNPSSGSKHEESEAINGSWTVGGNDTYFALVLGGSGVSYISRIEIEYETGDTPEPPIELEDLVINTPAFNLQEGNSTKLTASAVPSSANAQVTWTSSDTSVATVSADGTVTAVKAGTATITATSTANSKIKATATVTVTEAPFVSGSDNAQAFHNAVEAINGDGTLNTWRTTLNTAINAYKSLTATDKAEVTADIEKLKSEIASYNEKVKAYNDADKVALNGAGVFL